MQIEEYREHFPELVQKIYTRKAIRQVLETVERRKILTRVKERFTSITMKSSSRLSERRIQIAGRKGKLWNTSFKPICVQPYQRKKNEINTSEYAKENTKRSDAVRQFAIDWYLKGEMENLQYKESKYPDEQYDHAFFLAIQKAEEYLQPFFRYDLGKIYAIAWDSEEDGGSDGDQATLTVQKKNGETKERAAAAVSEYLPYGEYVIAEEQPYAPELLDFKNRHYEIDAPRRRSSFRRQQDSPGMIREKTIFIKERIPHGILRKST